jgi:hypothetical protein
METLRIEIVNPKTKKLLIEVSQRPKFIKYFHPDDVTKLLDLFDTYGELVKTKSDIKICRDIKDNFLLSLANDVNGNILYTHSIVPMNITLSGSVNTCYTQSSGIETLTTGPTLSITRSFLKKKLNSTLSSSVNRSYTGGKETNQVMSFRLNGSYLLKNRHNLNASFVVLNRTSKQSQVSGFTEFTGILGYNISF